MTLQQYRERLDHFLTLFGHEGGASTHTSANDSPRSAGGTINFWLNGSQKKAHWSSARTAAYLSAYIDFADDCTFDAQGLRLDDGGYIYLDRGVMCALLVGECVRFSDTQFTLTEKGEALIAPFVRLSREAV